MSNALAWARQYIAVPDAMYREYVEELLRMAERADKASPIDADIMPDDTKARRREMAMEILDNLMSIGLESGVAVDGTAMAINFGNRQLRSAHVSKGGLCLEFSIDGKTTASFTLSYDACRALVDMIVYQVTHMPEAVG